MHRLQEGSKYIAVQTVEVFGDEVTFDFLSSLCFHKLLSCAYVICSIKDKKIITASFKAHFSIFVFKM